MNGATGPVGATPTPAGSIEDQPLREDDDEEAALWQRMPATLRLDEPIRPDQFPLFLTTRRLLMLLDASLDPEQRFFYPSSATAAGKQEEQETLAGWLLDTEADDAEEEDEADESDEALDAAAGHQFRERDEVTEERFSEEFWPRMDERARAALSSSIVWREITSVIKGGSFRRERLGRSKYWGTFLQRRCSEEEYLAMAAKRAGSDLTERERSIVYQLFKRYEAMRRHRRMWDLNDLVFHLYTQIMATLKNLGHPFLLTFHTIFIDEVQDMTKAQIALMGFLCANPTSYTFVGDTAQTIASGVGFRFEDLRALFYALYVLDPTVEDPSAACEPASARGSAPPVEPAPAPPPTERSKSHSRSDSKQGRSQPGRISPPSAPQPSLPAPPPPRAATARTRQLESSFAPLYQLTHNFRTHKGVIGVAAALTAAMLHFFPNSIDALQPETAEKEGDKPIFLRATTQETLLVNLFGNGASNREISFGAEQVIIVRTPERKRLLQKSLKGSALVLTILESKGLEFNDVLVYDFFSDSSLGSGWRTLYNLMAENGFPCPSPMAFDAHRHHRLSSELKFLYVAVTRARSHLWLFDEDPELRRPFMDLMEASKLMNIVDEIAADGAVASALSSTSSDAAAFIRKGHELFARHLYSEARQFFLRGGDHAKATHALAASHRADARRHPRGSPASLKSFHQAATLYQGIGVYDKAAQCFRDARMYLPAAHLFAKVGSHDAASECFIKAHRYTQAADELFRAGTRSSVEKALFCLHKVHQYERGFAILGTICPTDGRGALDLGDLHVNPHAPAPEDVPADSEEGVPDFDDSPSASPAPAAPGPATAAAVAATASLPPSDDAIHRIANPAQLAAGIALTMHERRELVEYFVRRAVAVTEQARKEGVLLDASEETPEAEESPQEDTTTVDDAAQAESVQVAAQKRIFDYLGRLPYDKQRALLEDEHMPEMLFQLLVRNGQIEEAAKIEVEQLGRRADAARLLDQYGDAVAATDPVKAHTLWRQAAAILCPDVEPTLIPIHERFTFFARDLAKTGVPTLLAQALTPPTPPYIKLAPDDAQKVDQLRFLANKLYPPETCAEALARSAVYAMSSPTLSSRLCRRSDTEYRYLALLIAEANASCSGPPAAYMDDCGSGVQEMIRFYGAHWQANPFQIESGSRSIADVERFWGHLLALEQETVTVILGQDRHQLAFFDRLTVLTSRWVAFVKAATAHARALQRKCLQGGDTGCDEMRLMCRIFGIDFAGRTVGTLPASSRALLVGDIDNAPTAPAPAPTKATASMSLFEFTRRCIRWLCGLGWNALPFFGRVVSEASQVYYPRLPCPSLFRFGQCQAGSACPFSHQPLPHPREPLNELRLLAGDIYVLMEDCMRLAETVSMRSDPTTRTLCEVGLKETSRRLFEAFFYLMAFQYLPQDTYNLRQRIRDQNLLAPYARWLASDDKHGTRRDEWARRLMFNMTGIGEGGLPDPRRDRVDLARMTSLERLRLSWLVEKEAVAMLKSAGSHTGPGLSHYNYALYCRFQALLDGPSDMFLPSHIYYPLLESTLIMMLAARGPQLTALRLPAWLACDAFDFAHSELFLGALATPHAPGDFRRLFELLPDLFLLLAKGCPQALPHVLLSFRIATFLAVLFSNGAFNGIPNWRLVTFFRQFHAVLPVCAGTGAPLPRYLSPRRFLEDWLTTLPPGLGRLHHLYNPLATEPSSPDSIPLVQPPGVAITTPLPLAQEADESLFSLERLVAQLQSVASKAAEASTPIGEQEQEQEQEQEEEEVASAAVDLQRLADAALEAHQLEAEAATATVLIQHVVLPPVLRPLFVRWVRSWRRKQCALSPDELARRQLRRALERVAAPGTSAALNAYVDLYGECRVPEVRSRLLDVRQRVDTLRQEAVEAIRKRILARTADEEDDDCALQDAGRALLRDIDEADQRLNLAEHPEVHCDFNQARLRSLASEAGRIAQRAQAFVDRLRGIIDRKPRKPDIQFTAPPIADPRQGDRRHQRRR
ncbi:putative tRNA-splicing endonuclease positive effector [Paratrimastix pyriformis]|uniref:tRNA-splicing endonuclease positive effector n=1 Tax=Paratrimastix pyriformis TaxID=342808 RepID=A0ABQ8UFV7_9EUKA|nr:putative tRNA-splicing endonuclease positive effector [Paratrimastix pyriformis]